MSNSVRFMFMIAVQIIIFITAFFTWQQIGNANFIESRMLTPSCPLITEVTIQISDKIIWNYGWAFLAAFVINFLWSLTGWYAKISNPGEVKNYASRWWTFFFMGLLIGCVIYYFSFIDPDLECIKSDTYMAGNNQYCLVFPEFLYRKSV